MSIRHLAPRGGTPQPHPLYKVQLKFHMMRPQTAVVMTDYLENTPTTTTASEETTSSTVPEDLGSTVPTVPSDSIPPSVEAQPLRRSKRQTHAPERLYHEHQNVGGK